MDFVRFTRIAGEARRLRDRVGEAALGARQAVAADLKL